MHGAIPSVRLRPHHLLCILTYAGEGYSPAFIANLDDIVRRIAAEASVTIVEGPDDICAPCLNDGDTHCLRVSVTQRDVAARTSLEPVLGPLPPGTVVSLPAETIADLRRAFRSGGIRRACIGCDWAGLCTRIAGGGFHGVQLPG